MRSRDHAVYVISVADVPVMHACGHDVHVTCLLAACAELAAEGMNLEGIRRVMVLESEVDRLRAENDELRAVASGALNELERRAPRRDLVPLRQEVTVFGGKRLGSP